MDRTTVIEHGEGKNDREELLRSIDCEVAEIHDRIWNLKFRLVELRNQRNAVVRLIEERIEFVNTKDATDE